MKKATKIWIGIATVWPILYAFLFAAGVLTLMVIGNAYSAPAIPVEAPAPHGGEAEGAIAIALIGTVFFAHIFTIFLSFGMSIFYIVHVVKNEAMKSDMRVMWAILLFMAGFIAQPVYWYMNIWREPKDAAAAEHAAASGWETRNEPPDWR